MYQETNIHVFRLTFPLREIHKIQPKEISHSVQNIKHKDVYSNIFHSSVEFENNLHF